MKGPRTVPAWDDYYMGAAFIAASRSKDPDTQIGAIVVDKFHRPWGQGCNGAPRVVPDHEIDWTRPFKYPWVVHAEINALRHCRVSGLDDLQGCTIYVSGCPCLPCVREIVSRGLDRIVYGPHAWASFNEKEWLIVQDMCRLAGVKLERYAGDMTWLADKVGWMVENFPQAFPNLGLSALNTGKEDQLCRVATTPRRGKLRALMNSVRLWCSDLCRGMSFVKKNQS